MFTSITREGQSLLILQRKAPAMFNIPGIARSEKNRGAAVTTHNSPDRNHYSAPFHTAIQTSPTKGHLLNSHLHSGDGVVQMKKINPRYTKHDLYYSDSDGEIEMMKVGIDSQTYLDEEESTNGGTATKKSSDGLYGYGYIQGHILSQLLGGPAQADNLFPFTESTNASHETHIESYAKGLYSSFLKEKYAGAKYFYYHCWLGGNAVNGSDPSPVTEDDIDEVRVYATWCLVDSAGKVVAGTKDSKKSKGSDYDGEYVSSSSKSMTIMPFTMNTRSRDKAGGSID